MRRGLLRRPASVARTGIRRSSHHHRAATGQEGRKERMKRNPTVRTTAWKGEKRGTKGRVSGEQLRQAGLERNGMDGLWKPGGFSTALARPRDPAHFRPGSSDEPHLDFLSPSIGHARAVNMKAFSSSAVSKYLSSSFCGCLLCSV